MAKLFDIERNKLVLDAKILAIPAIKKLWTRDKSKDKDTAFKEISYIVFMHDFHSPYRDIKEGYRHGEVVKEIFEETWEPDKVILKAIEIYKKLQETPSMRLLESARKTLDKLSDYFDSIDFSEEDVMGKPKYSANDLTRNLKEVGNIVKSLANLEKQVKLELEEQNVRGDSAIGLYENPKE